MGQLKIFENEEFGQVRTVMRDGGSVVYCERCG